MSKKSPVLFEKIIQNKIFIIKNKKVMMGRDLAQLYEVETKILNQAVKRNIERFPTDFMFQLSLNEFQNWKSQIVTSNSALFSKPSNVCWNRQKS